MNLTGLLERRRWALEAHRTSKARQTRAERILRGEWRTVWPDLSETENEPVVENVFLEAAEDKAATAASIFPTFDVPPRRGTRADRAERESQLSRRVFVSLTQESRLDALHVGFYMDWFVHGLPAAIVWKDWTDDTGFPYAIQLEPRTLYPISWNAKGQLDEALIIRRRRLVDLIHEYGVTNPGLLRLGSRNDGRISAMYEEIWWADKTSWAVGVAYERGMTDQDFLYRRPDEIGSDTTITEWLIEPRPHGLQGCPIVAQRAISADREIRGKLDAMLPPLKMAQALQLEVLLNVRRSMHAPPLVQNVENPEEWGPDAIMRGIRGPDEAVVAYPRPPTSFEAFTHIQDQLNSARGAGAFPQQRSGDPGASIASGQAVTMLQGSYNAQQAWAQQDMARFYTDLFGRLANLDEVQCGGYSKTIEGFDEGEAFSDTYDPAKFWKGDYRVKVGFHALGVDAHTNLLNMGAAHRLGWLSRRTAMRKSGLVQNALAEERDIALDKLFDVFTELLQFQAANGDTSTLGEFINLIDSDEETTRSAMVKLFAQKAEQTAAQPGQAPQLSPELMQMMSGAMGGQAMGGQMAAR